MPLLLCTFVHSCFIMVLAKRLEDVRKMILSGHDVHFAQGLSCHTGRMKIKIKIGSARNIVPTALRPMLLASLDLFAEAAESHVAVDRGHNFSKGHAFVHLWLAPVQPGVSATIGVEENAALMSGTVTPMGHAEVEEATDEGEEEVALTSDLVEASRRVPCPPQPPPRPVEATRAPCPPPPPPCPAEAIGVRPPSPLPPKDCRAIDRDEVAGLRTCLLPPQAPCPPPLMPTSTPVPEDENWLARSFAELGMSPPPG